MSGFVGRYLVDELLLANYEVYGLVRPRSNTSNLEDIHLIHGDITDLSSVDECIGKVQPDMVFHLAAQSFVPASWNAPEQTMKTNVIGTMNVLEAVRSLCPECAVLVCGSSEEYGMVHPSECPIKETNPLRPLSPYGVSKVATDLLGYQYAHSYGMKIVRTRAFNHSGVGRGTNFVTTTICRQAAEIAAGKRDSFYLGNCDAVRDFTDVRDTVNAYRLLLEGVDAGRIESGEVFNIATNYGHTIKRVVDMAASASFQFIECDESKMRPSDVPVLIGDYYKLKEATGWTPTIPFSQTIREMVDWQRGLL